MGFNGRESYKRVNLFYGDRVSQLSGMSQKDWAKACKKLGLIVQADKGKGSHIRVVKDSECNPSHVDCLVMTIAKNQHNHIQREQVKRLVAYGDHYNIFNEKDVWEALGIEVSS